MEAKHTPGPWKKVRGHGRPIYQRENVTIDSRYRYSYLGGGRSGSVHEYWVESVGLWRGPFERLRDAKAYADTLSRSAIAKARGK